MWLRVGFSGQETSAMTPHLDLRSNHVPALLLVLLIIIALFVVGVAAVKLLIWLAIILAIIWLIGFFVRGAEGARWYRW